VSIVILFTRYCKDSSKTSEYLPFLTTYQHSNSNIGDGNIGDGNITDSRNYSLINSTYNDNSDVRNNQTQYSAVNRLLSTDYLKDSVIITVIIIGHSITIGK